MTQINFNYACGDQGGKMGVVRLNKQRADAITQLSFETYAQLTSRPVQIDSAQLLKNEIFVLKNALSESIAANDTVRIFTLIFSLIVQLRYQN